MQKVQLTVEVPKESHELAAAISGLVTKTIEAKKNDGKITVDEIFGIVSTEMGALSKAIDGLTEVSAEAKESGSGVALAIAVEAQKIEQALKA